MSTNRILFVGGGTVGHIAPSVAVWNECQKLRNDLEAHFVCSPRPDDAAFLKGLNLPYTIFNAPRVSLLYPIAFVMAVWKAKQIIKKQKPTVVFCKGGYVSIPLCVVAWLNRIPIVLHESDAVSGYANRIVGLFTKKICTGFPSKHIHTGNPVRADITKGSVKEGLKISGLSGEKPIMLVLGGSQGSVAINTIVTKLLKDLLLRCDIIHITGRGKSVGVESTNHYYQTEFVGEELKHFYACAGIALSRAGAGSIAELAANGIPSILVPLKGTGHNHQVTNAKFAHNHGGCIHIDQEDLEKLLLMHVHELVTDAVYCREMSHKMQSLNQSDAALQIAKIVVESLDSPVRHQ